MQRDSIEPKWFAPYSYAIFPIAVGVFLIELVHFLVYRRLVGL